MRLFVCLIVAAAAFLLSIVSLSLSLHWTISFSLDIVVDDWNWKSPYLFDSKILTIYRMPFYDYLVIGIQN